MKKILIVLFSLLLLVNPVNAQTKLEKDISKKKNKSIYLESGINLSLPVHIQMYRSHRLAIGFNVRAWKNISKKKIKMKSKILSVVT